MLRAMGGHMGVECMLTPSSTRCLRHVQAMGKRVLLLLPSKYLQREIPNHTCSKQRYNEITDADAALLAKWRAEGVLFE